MDHKEVWVPKNCYFQIVVLEKTLECPLESKINSLVEPGKLQSIRIAESDMTEAT